MLEGHLHRHFGFDSFKDGQKEVIELILGGESAGAIFPTGAGKSLCYQLPALQLPHMTLVVSPLLALMKDQIDFLASRGITAARLDSTLERDAYNETIALAKTGRLKILMISVERFKNERFRQHLEKMDVSLLVVDEAHCISEWGHNFRPEYLKLPRYRRQYHIGQTLLLTATATPQVIGDMCAGFEIPRKNVVVTGFYRKNLSLTVLPTDEANKETRLLRIIHNDPAAPTIVYVTLQHTSETVAEFLRNNGIHAAGYHAGMKNEDRENTQNRFMEGSISCVVATIAFGMGIDKADIRRVIHFDLPKSIENYGQEIGRAGRDGKASSCVVLANRDNISVLENFVYGDTPDKNAVASLLERIKAQSEFIWAVNLYTLVFELNIRPLPLKTLLVYLETAGIIRPKYMYFDQYAFQYLSTPEDIIGHFQDERAGFVRAVLENCDTKQVWTHVDMERILSAYDTNRERVVAALGYFEEKGWIRLQARQLIDVFDILDKRFDVADLSQVLHEKFKARETHEIERIKKMAGFFENQTCLSKALALYFGETMEKDHCGHCSVCNGKPAQIHRTVALEPLSGEILSGLLTDFFSACGPYCASRDAAKFLCGIQTPFFTRQKIKQMPNFGILKRYPFRDVKNCIEKQKENVR